MKQGDAANVLEFQGLKMQVPHGWQNETILSLAAPPATTSPMLLGQDQVSPANCQIARLPAEEALRIRLEDLADALGATREIGRGRHQGWLRCEIEVEAEDLFRQIMYLRQFGDDIVVVSASARASAIDRYRASFEATVASIQLEAA